MMKYFTTALILVIFSVETRLVDYVSTLYGTGNWGNNMGNNPTGVQYPFGLVRLSPDTESIFDTSATHYHVSGFRIYDPFIRVFSHLHINGGGAPDYGNIGIMPFRLSEGRKLEYLLHLTDYGFKSAYKQKEAVPGYYRVHLTENHLFEPSNIDVELTSTKYVGVHRYTFMEKSSSNFILFDISHGVCPGSCKGASVSIDPENQEIYGCMINQGHFMKRSGFELKIYFYAKTNVKWSNYGVWESRVVKYEERNATGTNIGAFLTDFDTSKVELFVGLSFISFDMAKKNLENDVKGLNGFDEVMSHSQSVWESELSRITISSPSDDEEEQLKTFYSGFYRTLCSPTLFSESEGYYLGFDSKIHQLEEEDQHFYTDLSIWDVFRTQFPLLTILRPDVMQDIVRSLLLMNEQGGSLPTWPLANGYTCSMIGDHAIIAIVDAYFKGIFRSGKLNVSEAYEAMKGSAMRKAIHCPRMIEEWVKWAYIPDDYDHKNGTKSVCITLAYAYDDGILSKLAKDLGEESDYRTLLNRSMNYKNVFDHEKKFFCPRSSKGKFTCPLEMASIGEKLYTEGDAWHWRFYPLHDISGLIELLGGDHYFVDQLEIFVKKNFEYESLNYYGLRNPYFWVGNEHNLASPWLFNYANRGDLTQKYIPEVIKTYYSSKPEGCPGNDDYGEISSWMVFGSLGFYPIAGTTDYSISSPLFEEFTISYGVPKKDVGFEDCKMHFKLEIFGGDNKYIQRITVNGVSHYTLFFDHNKDFVDKCNLEIIMYMGENENPRLE